MADPIQLPNSQQKNFSTAKVSKTARQKFQNRHKRRQKDKQTTLQNRSGKQQGGRETDSTSGRSEGHLRAQKTIHTKEKKDSSPGQGKVIDIRI